MICQIIDLYIAGTCMSHCESYRKRNTKSTLGVYLLLHSFITPDQSAYLKKHRAQTCLHKVVYLYDWLTNLNDGLITGVSLTYKLL